MAAAKTQIDIFIVVARTAAMTTSFPKSFVSIDVMSSTEAPIIFLMPISRLRICAVYIASPKTAVKVKGKIKVNAQTYDAHSQLCNKIFVDLGCMILIHAFGYCISACHSGQLSILQPLRLRRAQ